jgi:hypothetical protein
MIFEINKAGESKWYKAKGLTAQDAIEQHFKVNVYPYGNKYRTWIFDDLRNDVDQLYGARLTDFK